MTTDMVVVNILKFYPREYTCIWVCIYLNVYIQGFKENILEYSRLKDGLHLFLGYRSYLGIKI